jgi:hypothetical protein
MCDYELGSAQGNARVMWMQIVMDKNGEVHVIPYEV